MFLDQLPPGVVEVVGFVAGTLTTLSFIPQITKAWRSRSTGDLSTTMLTTFSTGVALWLIYGFAVWSMPIVLANGITLGLTGVLLLLKLRQRP